MDRNLFDNYELERRIDKLLNNNPMLHDLVREKKSHPRASDNLKLISGNTNVRFLHMLETFLANNNVFVVS